MRKKILFLAALMTITVTACAQNPGFAGNKLKDLQKVHPWTGARVAYFGDSLTDPRNNGSKKKYWGFLQDYLNITPFVYGVSGREWNDIPRQAQKLKSEHGDNFDAITILIGTNDYNHGVPIGQWYTETAESVRAAAGNLPNQLYPRLQRHLSMDPNTFCGRINIAIDSLKSMFPTKQIVLFTTPHRSLFDPNDHNIQPDETYTNKIGLYLDAYNKAIIEAGQVWGLPVIDLSALSGINPMVKGQQLYMHNEHDLLHPSDAGHDRMARTMVYQLLTLPCYF